VVKQLWDYIKSNELQNPNNKKEILCDSKLKAVFGVDKIGMFIMNKALGRYVQWSLRCVLLLNVAGKASPPNRRELNNQPKTIIICFPLTTNGVSLSVPAVYISTSGNVKWIVMQNRVAGDNCVC